MKQVFAYIAHKHLELLLFVIIAVFLYREQIALPVSLTILMVTGVVLGVYEYEVGRKFPFHILALLRRFGLEVALLGVLVLLMILWNVGIERGGALLVVYFVIVCMMNSRYLQRGIAQGFWDMRRDTLPLALLLILLALMLIWQFKMDSMFFLLTFSAFLLYRWDSRIVALGALASLASCPVLLILQEQSLAEQMAVYAYYFLVMTVVLQIVEYKNERPLV